MSKEEKKVEEKQVKGLKRRKSLYKDFDAKMQLFRPEYRLSLNDESKKKIY